MAFHIIFGLEPQIFWIQACSYYAHIIYYTACEFLIFNTYIYGNVSKNEKIYIYLLRIENCIITYAPLLQTRFTLWNLQLLLKSNPTEKYITFYFFFMFLSVLQRDTINFLHTNCSVQAHDFNIYNWIKKNHKFSNCLFV